MYFISAASSITHQPTFKNDGFSDHIAELKPGSQLQTPNFKEYINPTNIRRMSEILRTAITCSLDCLRQAHINQPDAIIVGTGLGCLNETEKFLKNIIPNEGELISPTSFIQSTHNTVAGQISIILGNHNYNMTHTQNALSFEHALQDAVLCIDEGKENILVGGADEHIEILDGIVEELGYKNLHLTSGSSFFVLSKTKSEQALAKIIDVTTQFSVSSIAETIKIFLNQNKIDVNKIDLVLYSSMDAQNTSELKSLFTESKIINYLNYSGTYFTNVALALHYAVDMICYGKDKVKRILICNSLDKNQTGLIIVEALET